MKLGILTFHSQLNYGGVLQALSMQHALRLLGHDAYILDCWLNPENTTLTLKPRSTFRQWIRRVLELLFCVGWRDLYKRGENTRSFINKYLRLTPYHFYRWGDSLSDIDLDGIVVGSDQVWGCFFTEPGVYLLEGAPKIPAISYAASIGMKEFPLERIAQYKAGFARFSRILVREHQAKEMIKEIGYEAENVLDPTLLIPKEEWAKVIKLPQNAKSNRIFCYFLRYPILEVMRKLVCFAEKYNLYFDVLTNSKVMDLPLNIKSAVELYHWWTRPRNSRVRLRLTDGPKEFLHRLSAASFVISDSFHALMFSTIFRKKIRILAPNTESSLRMFDRIKEFDDQYYENGSIISENLEVALKSYFATEQPIVRECALNRSIEESRNELISALKLL